MGDRPEPTSEAGPIGHPLGHPLGRPLGRSSPPPGGRSAGVNAPSRFRLALALCLWSSVWPTPPARADVVGDWNVSALQLLAETGWQVPRQQRALAMMHAAIFDAVNAVRPAHVPFVPGLPTVPGASEAAAASQAAAAVLRQMVPTAAERIDVANAALLDAVADPEARAGAILLGAAAARAVLAAREDDGADWSTDFVAPAPGPGVYQKTGEGRMAAPRLGRMRPFVLNGADQFRPPPPAAPGSAQFARDLAEVRILGGADSTARTAEQTQVALFHVPAGNLPWNAIARQVIKARGLPLSASARVMARLNFALMDAFSAGYDAKYEYASWRPVTAIRADGDGDWRAAVANPLFPEYPCQHCIVGGAAAAVLQQELGEGAIAFTVCGPGGAVRAYRSFRHFAEEEAISRVYAGVHYRWSLIVGAALGQQVGEWAARNALQPRP